MPKFLIDVNLPYYFSVWNTEDFIHQVNINDKAKDSEIWEYEKANNLTIVTKDSDFSNKVLFNTAPPKVIHIKFGNLKLKQFHDVLSNIWDKIVNMNEDYKLVNVFTDRIEGIN